MKAPSAEAIRSFLVQQFEYWNAGNREAFINLYRGVSSKGLKIEYVGQPIGDGWETLNHMWDEHNSILKAEIVEILVNGNEGACYVRNILVSDGTVNPSIEIYRFENDALHVRYFYRPRS